MVKKQELIRLLKEVYEYLDSYPMLTEDGQNLLNKIGYTIDETEGNL